LKCEGNSFSRIEVAGVSRGDGPLGDRIVEGLQPRHGDLCPLFLDKLLMGSGRLDVCLPGAIEQMRVLRAMAHLPECIHIFGDSQGGIVAENRRQSGSILPKTGRHGHLSQSDTPYPQHGRRHYHGVQLSPLSRRDR
jgi:hypothetical protein